MATRVLFVHGATRARGRMSTTRPASTSTSTRLRSTNRYCRKPGRRGSAPMRLAGMSAPYCQSKRPFTVNRGGRAGASLSISASRSIRSPWFRASTSSMRRRNADALCAVKISPICALDAPREWRSPGHRQRPLSHLRRRKQAVEIFVSAQPAGARRRHPRVARNLAYRTHPVSRPPPPQPSRARRLLPPHARQSYQSSEQQLEQPMDQLFR